MKSGLGENEKKWIASDMELTAMYAMFVGLVLFPVTVRYYILKADFGQFAYINIPFAVGIALLLLAKAFRRNYTKSDYKMLLIWALCAALMFYANYEKLPGKSWCCFFNILLPVVLNLYHFDKDTFSRFMKHLLIVFDIIMILYVILAIEECLNSHALLNAIYEVFPVNSIKSDLNKVAVLNRFFSIWGHALYSAVYFTAFFIINDLYFHCSGKKYPKILFFLLALIGCSLCASKTSFVVLIAYMLISCIMEWKKNKWLLLGSASAFLVAYVFGAMDSIIVRFMVMMHNVPDRISSIVRYFHTGVYPLRWIKGYGARFAWNELSEFHAGFEFPILADALHFGILFSLLLLVGWYLYVSVLMLRKRQHLCWIGFTAIYVEVNSFNGIALETQDVFNWVSLFSMVMLNCALCLQPDRSEDEKPKKHRIRQMKLFALLKKNTDRIKTDENIPVETIITAETK